MAVHRVLEKCRACPNMIPPVIHGPPVVSRVMLIGQAPGPREGQFMKPFAWTAGKTLFRWFEANLGVDEEAFRRGVYISAVARCFPGKASGGGDRRPDPREIAACGRFLEDETKILRPELILPVGTMAIEQVLGRKVPLADLIGTVACVTYRGVVADVIALPHPSGASPWHKLEPGKSLVKKALALIGKHPAWRDAFP
jgi:uracil-DNA glycosylase